MILWSTGQECKKGREPLEKDNKKSTASEATPTVQENPNTKKIDVKQFYKGKQFLHNKFGDFLIKQYHIIKLQHKGISDEQAISSPIMMYSPKYGIYEHAAQFIPRVATKYIEGLKNNQIKEVIGYIDRKARIVPVTEPQLISVLNGVLNPYTKEFKPFSPNTIVTYRLPVVYNPQAVHAPLLDTFMINLFNDDAETHEFIYKIIGYGMSYNNFLQKFFLLAGTGGNGKSAFLELIHNMYGDWNISSVPLNKLDGVERFAKSDLLGKMLNLGDDIDKTAIRETGDIKKIVSGEPIRAEYKGQNAFIFVPRAKLFFSANALPNIYDNSDGMQDRITVVPFVNRIRDTEKADNTLLPRITNNTDEMSVLLNRALDGLQQLLHDKRLIRPKVVEECTNQYMKDINPVALFEDACINGEVVIYTSYGGQKAFVIDGSLTTDVYEQYSEWCNKNGYKPLNSRNFGKELYRIGYERVQVRKGEYRGQRVYKMMEHMEP